VQQLFEQRIGAMLENDRPAFQSYAPEDDPAFARLIASAPGREAVQTYLMERDRFVSRLEALDEGAWRRTGVHPTFGEFDIEFLVEYLAHHEAHHVYQIFTRRLPFVRRPPPAGP
jgi:hypothetical protein